MSELSGLASGDAFVIGCIGGALIDIVGIYNLRHEFNKLADDHFLKSKIYWLSLPFWALVGGGAAYAVVEWSSNSINEFLALQIGATWPAVIERLGARAPKVSPGAVD